jgi:aryl-alcohol dehydrogenase-like predicted oxidoreductase
MAKIEGSLRRLRTDYVDILYLHMPDCHTPLEETLRTVNDLITCGKVRYLACCWHPAWQVAEMMAIADRRGWSAPVAVSDAYSLLDRAIEKELIPACARFGLSVIPFFPLAAGLLTGKYARGAKPPPESKYAIMPDFQLWLTEETYEAVDEYQRFAQIRGRSIRELALVWLLQNPIVCSVIVGATSVSQMEENVKAIEWELEPEEVRDLAAMRTCEMVDLRSARPDQVVSHSAEH